MSKEELMAAIRACARKLGRAPTLRELLAGTRKKITRYDIHHHLGGYTKALRASGLNATGSGRAAEVRDLFLDWAAVTRSLGRIPTLSDYEQRGRYSIRPLLNRFGNWTNVPLGLENYALETGLAAEWKDVLSLAARHHRRLTERCASPSNSSAAAATAGSSPRIRPERPLLGPPMTRSALAHAPSNEAGVIYLFGAMARELGFVVTHIQTVFPDCEAMRQVGQDRWQRVRIEFEYASRNFLKHLHRAEDCDLVVCWIHNWPDCPLEVLALKTRVGEMHEMPITA